MKFEPWAFHGYLGVVEAETIESGVCVVIIGMADDQGLMVLKYPDKGPRPGDDRARRVALLALAVPVCR